MNPIFLFLLAAALPLSALAENAGSTLTGANAFGDWKADKPGLHRLITPADLPEPHATNSATNGPHIVPKPPEAVLRVPAGFDVFSLATGLKEPRQMKLAPNGDVFISESGARALRIIPAAMVTTGGVAGAPGQLLTFADGFAMRPYGIAFYPPGPEPKYVYVALEDRILRYPYHNGDHAATGPAETIVPNLPVGHHWTRDVIFTQDGSKMLVAVGSGSNDAEEGIAEEFHRANILEYTPEGHFQRIYASGLRNPVTLGLAPGTNTLWTTVNERDGMGDNLPPDYVTRVQDSGFYGWPYYYIGAHEDPVYKDRRQNLKDSVLTPDVLLQPHSAPLGLAFYTGSQFPEAFRGGLFVALHGSWNRANRTGYKLVHVALSRGKPSGEYEDFLTGFVTQDGNVWGRPVGVVMAVDGSLLMSDDASGTIWRIAYTPKR